MHDCNTISTGFILDRKNYWLGLLFWFCLDWFGLTAFLNEHFRALAHLVRDLPSKFVDVCLCIRFVHSQKVQATHGVFGLSKLQWHKNKIIVNKLK